VAGAIGDETGLRGLGFSADNRVVSVSKVAPVDVEALFTRFGPMVHRRCRMLLHSESDADDATQEVFVRVVRRAASGEARLTADIPAAYLWKVATNVCLNRLRIQKRKPSTSIEGKDEAGRALIDTIAAVDDGVSTSAFRRALDRLFGEEPESTRVMAVLHFVDGLTLEETAQEMAMSVSGVRKRLRVFQTKIQARTEREELP